MKLAALLQEIEQSPGAVTVADLAGRLGSTPEVVRAMLAALRAAGRLGPGGGNARPDAEGCPAAGSCPAACPGRADCPFLVEFGSGLELRPRPPH